MPEVTAAHGEPWYTHQHPLRFRVCVQQVGHALHLRQIHLAVEERASRELARLRGDTPLWQHHNGADNARQCVKHATRTPTRHEQGRQRPTARLKEVTSGAIRQQNARQASGPHSLFPPHWRLTGARACTLDNAASTAATTARPPCTCTSTTSSPVYVRGAGNHTTMPLSSGRWESGWYSFRACSVRGRREARVAPGGQSSSASSAAVALEPVSRTTAMAALEVEVDSANTVDLEGESAGADGPGAALARAQNGRRQPTGLGSTSRCPATWRGRAASKPLDDTCLKHEAACGMWEKNLTLRNKDGRSFAGDSRMQAPYKATMVPLALLPSHVLVELCAAIELDAIGRLGLTCRALASALYGSACGSLDAPPDASRNSREQCSEHHQLWAALGSRAGVLPEPYTSPICTIRRRAVAERRWRTGAYVKHELKWRDGSESDGDPDAAGAPAGGMVAFTRVYAARLVRSASGAPLALTVHETDAEEAEGETHRRGVACSHSHPTDVCRCFVAVSCCRP